MDDNTRDYAYQMEYHKKDGRVFTAYVFSSGEGFVYSVYESGVRQKQAESSYRTIDDAFQGAFEYVKGLR